MKKLVLLTLVLAVVASLAAVPVFARSDNAKGAVKVALVEVADPDNVVGWAICNSNGDGMVNVQIHLDNGEPNKTFNVQVKMRDGTEKNVDIGTVTLTTNDKGKGNAHAQGVIPAGKTQVKVVLWDGDIGIGTKKYRTSPHFTALPLK